MNLDELAVRIRHALLIHRTGRRPCVNDRVRRFAENNPWPPRRQNHGIRRKRRDFHRAQVLCRNPAADAFFVQHNGEELPVFVFGNQPGCFMAAYLLIQCIQQLLSGRRSGKRRTMVLRPAKPAEIKQALRRAVEHHAHPVHQVNNAGRCLTHRLNGRLVSQEVPAVYRVVKMLPGRVAFPFRIDGSVNAALRAHRVGTFHRHERKELHRHARFGRFDRSHQAGQAAANDD
ncbi:hypothetical protein D3C74_271340 [compost metagenome]